MTQTWWWAPARSAAISPDGSSRRGGAIDPKLLRSTARRVRAVTEEIRGSHGVFLSQPKAVADVIDRAAKAVGGPAR
jgi:hypothetical protein